MRSSRRAPGSGPRSSCRDRDPDAHRLDRAGAGSGAAFLGGLGLAIHLTLWFTVFQQQVPKSAQSRVASYDTLGSFVLMPIGMALVGPLADAIGIAATLWIALGVMWVSWVGILALPSVWAIRRGEPLPAASPA